MPNKLVWEYLLAPPKEAVEALTRSLFKEVLPWHRTIASLLLQRGIKTETEAKRYFNPTLKGLENPLLISGMQKAVSGIRFAIEREQVILIYGDYDVDGTCAVSILYLFLRRIYPNVITYVPDRYKEGYGVSKEGIDYADDNNVKLIITLDCGIQEHEKVNYAKGKGIGMIITDHHTPPKDPPKALAVLNPKQKDCSYPYKELCGAGIAFKLVQALCKEFDRPLEEAYEFLDLVALATCADIVPLTGENRVLVAEGLRRINDLDIPTPVLDLLLSSAKKPVRVRDLVFVAAPRINAAGRMAHAKAAINLLTCQKESELTQIEILNQQRKSLDREILEEALAQIADNHEEDASATVVFSENWHKGVIGIVASRLMETFYRPTIVLTKSGDVIAGSARSVEGYNLYEALSRCKDYLIQFGGHAAAAGMTLSLEQYPWFKSKFLWETALTLAKQTPKIVLSTQMPLSEISYEFYKKLQDFAPFGPENMDPVFYAHEVLVKEVRVVGADKSHVRMILTDATQRQEFVAVGFGLAPKKSLIESGQPLTIAYQLTENEWQGRKSLELILKAVKPMTNE